MPKSLSNLIKLVIVTLIALVPTLSFAENTDSSRQLLQLAEYITVDYHHAVENGQIINNDEYQEMLEFSAEIVTQTSAMQDPKLVQAARAIQQAVAAKADLADLGNKAAAYRNALLKKTTHLQLPTSLSPAANTARLFQQLCASCHGSLGKGDGAFAIEQRLDPPPVDFTDFNRAKDRSILGLHDAIAQGITGTAMAGFSTSLSEKQIWSLAFYAGSLAFAGNNNKAPATTPSLQQLVNYSPATLVNKLPSVNMDNISYLRNHPQQLFSAKADPITLTITQLRAAQQAYNAGELNKAKKLAISAYLDGFELAENSLNGKAPALRKQIETKMMGLRQLLGQPAQQTQVASTLNELFAQLDLAADKINNQTLSNPALFATSFVILLREGIEALLVVLALTTILIRTQRKDVLKYVHIGWITAIIAGVATWWLARNLINISGASREIMEGLTTLAAALIIFYVGFWMHSKTQASQWQQYIKKHIEQHLSSGTLWGISALAFIAVYREIFETILFYESLLIQLPDNQFIFFSSGFASGVLALAVITWVVIRYSARLPIKTFFTVTTYLMLILAFVLMGKAITALQEAAVVSLSPLSIDFSVSWLGIYPTWEGLAAQLAVLVLSVSMLLFYRKAASR